MKWTMDYCAQALRNIAIGKGGKMDGFEMDSGFQITVSSEVMAILAVAKDLRDFRERIGRMVVAYDRTGREITTRDLEVDGAMTAWMVKALNPNLLQTIEGQPVFVHAGPFANIAIGQSSVIADQLGVRLSEYVVTESGFGADIGYEKFWNLKCRYSGLRPDAVVVVATIRALKMHGGGPPVKPGAKLDRAHTEENLALVENGCANLLAHIEIVKKSGVTPVVCLNGFHTDTKDEVDVVRRVAESVGALFAVGQHWLKGGEGAVELAEAVETACRGPNRFRHLYDLNLPLRTRIERIAGEVYGAVGVTYSDAALARIKGMGFQGVHIGGFALKTQDFRTIIERAAELTPRWEEFVPEVSFGRKGGSGCYCPENALLRALIAHLFTDADTALVLDMEAGIEHLSRGTLAGVDRLLIVTEPGRRSLETALRIAALAGDIGLTRLGVVGNKIRGKDDKRYLTDGLRGLAFAGFLPLDDKIRAAEAAGRSVRGASTEIERSVETIVQALDETTTP